MAGAGAAAQLPPPAQRAADRTSLQVGPSPSQKNAGLAAAARQYSSRPAGAPRLPQADHGQRQMHQHQQRCQQQPCRVGQRRSWLIRAAFRVPLSSSRPTRRGARQTPDHPPGTAAARPGPRCATARDSRSSSFLAMMLGNIACPGQTQRHAAGLACLRRAAFMACMMAGKALERPARANLGIARDDGGLVVQSLALERAVLRAARPAVLGFVVGEQMLDQRRFQRTAGVRHRGRPRSRVPPPARYRSGPRRGRTTGRAHVVGGHGIGPHALRHLALQHVQHGIGARPQEFAGMQRHDGRINFQLRHRRRRAPSAAGRNRRAPACSLVPCTSSQRPRRSATGWPNPGGSCASASAEA